ncbi:DUF488 domain-containing protein [Brachybacterium phenoliresistens]|uniref:MarR family transcriptional regulator n=1 Tax=Brachybacterium phenoliresistens TaxID=396014 RepID=Z9JWT1_9MICO|nr:MarR family transcriptional regulator [Brachybacterium phenoliresistens]
MRDVLDTSAEPAELRVLVDRLWPRGVRKDRLPGIAWDTDACPSDALRRALHGGDLSREEFAARYRAELARSGAADALLARAAGSGARTVSLLTDVRAAESSHAAVLAAVLEEALAEPRGAAG